MQTRAEQYVCCDDVKVSSTQVGPQVYSLDDLM